MVFGSWTDYDGGGRELLLRDWTWCTARHVAHCTTWDGRRHVVWVFRSRASAQRAIDHYGTKASDRSHMTPFRVD